MPKAVLPSARAIADGSFIEAILDQRTRLDYVQGGRVRHGRDWQVQRRTIAEHLLYLVTEHACESRIAGRPSRHAAGAFVWVMPGVVHEFRVADGRGTYGMIHLKVGIYARGRALRPARPAVELSSALELQPAMLEVARLGETGGRFTEPRLRAALVTLLAEALVADTATGGGRAFTARQQQLLADHVAEHLARRPAPSELAALLGLSSDYFTRAFRSTYGIPPRAWLVRERMNAAAAWLVDSSASISRIAAELGFSDLFLFSRQFKRVFGRSPRAYRRDPTTRA